MVTSSKASSRSNPLLLAAAVVSALPSFASAGARDYAQLGQPCMQRYESTTMAYKDISSLWKRNDKCQPGVLTNSTSSDHNSKFALTCFVAPNDNGMEPRSGTIDLEGTCLKSSCVGINDNNVNAIVAPTLSERVTICHRTENDMNPWVRMTVDKQAWEDSGNDCGFTTEDYVVKEHGSRSSVEDAMNKGRITDFLTTREYWEYWDRACPYVRQDPDHPHRCCKGDDCCGDASPANAAASDAASADGETDPERSEAPPIFERRLQGGGNGALPNCLPVPSQQFEQKIYVTFMGDTSKPGLTLKEHVEQAGSTIPVLENELKNVYNAQGANGQCNYYQRFIQSVEFDTIGTPLMALNKSYDLVGFRVEATVKGQCEGCGQHLFLPADMCETTRDTACPTCVPPNSSDGIGKIVQISGKTLYPTLNANLGLSGTSAEIFRMQGDVAGEKTCGANQLKYLEATGEVVCL